MWFRKLKKYIRSSLDLCEIDGVEAMTSTTVPEICSDEGAEEKEQEEAVSDASDGNDFDDNNADTEKQEASMGSEAKLSKRQLRKMKKKENTLKYRAEKRSVLKL